MGLKEPLNNESKTHGICDECFEKLQNEIQESKQKRKLLTVKQ
jgi:hypothetical protein